MEQIRISHDVVELGVHIRPVPALTPEAPASSSSQVAAPAAVTSIVTTTTSPWATTNAAGASAWAA